MSEIEQLWYTWSTRGLGGVTGFRVRAASHGLKDIQSTRFQTLDHHLRYELPVGVSNYAITPEQAPCCLALLQTESERIIVHKAYVGKDLYGRPGVFFCHLLANFPQDIPASAVIDLWRSPFWQTRDSSDESVSLLPVDLDTLDPGALEEEQLLKVVDYLPAVIYAFLLLEAGQKVYIAAQSSDDVAALIWGLTRSLPLPLQRSITFSTYESNLTESPAQIVGIWQTAEMAMPPDFPTTLHSDVGFAINLLEEPPHLPPSKAATFAYFATRCIQSDDSTRLSEMLSTAEQYIIPSSDTFLSLARVIMAIEEGHLSRTEVMYVLDDPILAIAYLKHPEVQKVLLAEAVKDSVWWEQAPKPAIIRLHQQRDSGVKPKIRVALEDIAQYAITVALADLHIGKNVCWLEYLTILGILAPPKYMPGIWQQLLLEHYTLSGQQKLPARLATVSWSDRYLLLSCLFAIADELPMIHLRSWLPQNADELLSAQRQKQALPESWVQEAISKVIADCLKSHAYPATLITIAETYPAAFHHAVLEIWSDQVRRPALFPLLSEVMDSTYSERIPLLAKLLTTPEVTYEDIIRALEYSRPNEHSMETLLNQAPVPLIEAYQQLFEEGQKQGQTRSLQVIIEKAIVSYLKRTVPLQRETIPEQDLQIIEYLFSVKSGTFPPRLAEMIEDHYWLQVQLNQLKSSKSSNLSQTLKKIGGAIQRQETAQKSALRRLWYIAFLRAMLKDAALLPAIISTIAPCMGIDELELLQKLAEVLGSRYSNDVTVAVTQTFLDEAGRCSIHLSERQERIEYIVHICQALFQNIKHTAHKRYKDNTYTFNNTIVIEGHKQWYTMSHSGLTFSLPLPWQRKNTQEAAQDTLVTPVEASSEQDWLLDIETLLPKVMHFKELYVPKRIHELEKMAKGMPEQQDTQKALRPHLEEELEILQRCQDKAKAEREIGLLIDAYNLLQQKLQERTEQSLRNAVLHEPEKSQTYAILTTGEEFQKQYKKLLKNTKFTEKDAYDVVQFFIRLRFFSFYLADEYHNTTLSRWYQTQNRNSTTS